MKSSKYVQQEHTVFGIQLQILLWQLEHYMIWVSSSPGQVDN